MAGLLLNLFSPQRAWGALGAAALVGLAGVQTARLAHAKSDLAAARTAQIDPSTRRPWQAEAKAAAADLASCQAGLGRLDGALASQSAALTALKSEEAAASAAAQQALVRAQGQAKSAAGRAAAILSARPSSPACADTDALILRSLDP